MAIFVGTEGEDYIVGSSSADSILGDDGNDTLEGGKGNDTLTGGSGSDVFVYGSGDGNDIITDYENEDMISLKSGSVTSVAVNGSDYIFTIGTGRITVKGAASKYVHVIDKNGNDTWWPDLPAPSFEISKSGKKLTLTEDFMDDSLDITNTAELSNVKNTIVTIDASAVQTDLAITANKKANIILGGEGNDTLIGGKGNDTLMGGDGSDVFVYSKGDGKDVITDYTSDDIISLKSGAVSAASVKGDDYIFKVGSGRITVKGAASKYVHFVDKNGNDIWYPEVPPTPIEITKSGKKIVLTEGFTDDSLNITTATELSPIKNTIVTIDASAVQTDLALTANKKANRIIGGDGNDTLIGGKGNDTLMGGEGSDVFVYSKGDGKDVITDYTSDDIISLKSGAITSAAVSGNDYIFKVGSGRITVKNAADKYVHIVDKNGNDTWYPEVPAPSFEISNSGKRLTLTQDFASESLNVKTEAAISNYKDTIVTIDASAVQIDLALTANNQSNYIIGSSQNDYIDGGAGRDTIFGGEGNDTLKGGSGADVFVYNDGDGNDLITDYSSEDVFKVASGVISNDVSIKDDTVIFKIGNGRVSLQGAVGKAVTIIDEDGNQSSRFYSGNAAWFMEDDNNFSADNQLDSLLETKTYLPAQVETSTDLFKENNFITYSDKK